MPLQPLRFSQLFDLTVNATVRRFWALAGLVLLAAVPIRAVEVVILTATISNPEDITSRSAFSQTGAPTNGAIGVNLTVSLLGGLVTVIGAALCFKVAAAAYAGARADWRSSLAFAAPRLATVGFDLSAGRERLDMDLLERRLEVAPGTATVPPAAAAPGRPGPAESGDGPAPEEEWAGWAPPAPPSDVTPPSDWAPPRPPSV